jgi:hypothetical protein
MPVYAAQSPFYGYFTGESERGQDIGFEGLLPQETSADSGKWVHNDGLKPTNGLKVSDFSEPIR